MNRKGFMVEGDIDPRNLIPFSKSGGKLILRESDQDVDSIIPTQPQRLVRNNLYFFFVKNFETPSSSREPLGELNINTFQPTTPLYSTRYQDSNSMQNPIDTSGLFFKNSFIVMACLITFAENRNQKSKDTRFSIHNMRNMEDEVMHGFFYEFIFSFIIDYTTFLLRR